VGGGGGDNGGTRPEPAGSWPAASPERSAAAAAAARRRRASRQRQGQPGSHEGKASEGRADRVALVLGQGHGVAAARGCVAGQGGASSARGAVVASPPSTGWGGGSSQQHARQQGLLMLATAAPRAGAPATEQQDARARQGAHRVWSPRKRRRRQQQAVVHVLPVGPVIGVNEPLFVGPVCWLEGVRSVRGQAHACGTGGGHGTRATHPAWRQVVAPAAPLTPARPWYNALTLCADMCTATRLLIRAGSGRGTSRAREAARAGWRRKRCGCAGLVRCASVLGGGGQGKAIDSLKMHCPLL